MGLRNVLATDVLSKPRRPRWLGRCNALRGARRCGSLHTRRHRALSPFAALLGADHPQQHDHDQGYRLATRCQCEQRRFRHVHRPGAVTAAQSCGWHLPQRGSDGRHLRRYARCHHPVHLQRLGSNRIRHRNSLGRRPDPHVEWNASREGVEVRPRAERSPDRDIHADGSIDLGIDCFRWVPLARANARIGAVGMGQQLGRPGRRRNDRRAVGADASLRAGRRRCLVSGWQPFARPLSGATLVLGRERGRPTRRRKHPDPEPSPARRRSERRVHGGRRRRSHAGTQERRHDLVMGSQPERAARRHDHQSAVHAGCGRRAAGVTITKISAGANHSLGLDSLGRVWAWGYNQRGQLGDNSISQRTSARTHRWIRRLDRRRRSGWWPSLARPTASGLVYAWGLNTSGQLGDNSNSQRLVPTLVPSLTGVTAISAGGTHSLALKPTGLVWAWGSGTQVGDGAGVNRFVPVAVQGGLSGSGSGFRW